MLLVLECHLCIWRGTIITLLQFFLLCIGFYNILIKLLTIFLNYYYYYYYYYYHHHY